MAHNSSQSGAVVESLSVDTDPHERYSTLDPHTGKEIKPGIPILKGVTGGNIMLKNVIYTELTCPQCDSIVKYDSDEEPVCPNCSVVCDGGEWSGDRMIRDERAAGRFNGENNND